MKTVAMIPIKLNNERVPGKNLKCFDDGTPLISFIQKTLVQVKNLDETYIFCSDDRIKDFIIDGIRYLKRPSSLDTNETLSTDLIRWFVDTVDADIYVMAHATSPFISVGTCTTCIDKVKSGEHDSAFTALKIQNFMWYQGRPLNYDAQRPPRTQDLEPVYSQVSGIFVFRKEVFEELNARIGKNPYICECNDIESVDIDHPINFDIANAIYMRLLCGK